MQRFATWSRFCAMTPARKILSAAGTMRLRDVAGPEDHARRERLQLRRVGAVGGDARGGAGDVAAQAQRRHPRANVAGRRGEPE